MKTRTVCDPRAMATLAIVVCAGEAFAQSEHAGAQGEVVATEVVRGAAEFTGDGSTTTITASDGAIIEYAKFGIPEGATVEFLQPSEAARVLNRVVGPDPSAINGALLANGVVYIVNPAGVIFGPDSVVDVGGIVAAAAHISDADFLARVDRFHDAGGPVVNRGVIRAQTIAHLMGDRVVNVGSVIAPEGVVSFTAGDDVLLAEPGSRLSVRVEGGAGRLADAPNGSAASDAAIVNEGDVRGGDVLFSTGDVYGLAIRSSGDVRATDGVRMAANSGDVEVGGAVSATDGARGGSIDLTGDRVVLDGARVDASGRDAGGAVRIDTSKLAFVTADSAVDASAKRAGDGGTIHLISGDAAGVYGDLTATGAAGGKGGFIETSAPRLRVAKAPDAGGGQWLIDPFDLEIVSNGAGGAGVTPTPDGFESTAAGAQIEVGQVVAGLLLGDVRLLTGPGAGDGNITLSAQLDFDGVQGSELTLEAANDIILARDIRDFTLGDGDSLDLRLRADADGSGAGDVMLMRDVELGDGRFRSTGVNLVASDFSEVIAGSVEIGEALSPMTGDVVVPSRMLVDDAVTIRAAGAVTFQPGSIIADALDARAGTDGTGNLSFEPGDLTVNADRIEIAAGIPTTGTATVDALTESPVFQGRAFGSLPGFFSIAQSADLSSGALPQRGQFGDGSPAPLAGMDYSVEVYGLESPTSGYDLTITGGSRFAGADLRLAASGDLNINAPLDVGAFIAAADEAFLETGDLTIAAPVDASGGVYQGAVAGALLTGWNLDTQMAAGGRVNASTTELYFRNDAALVSDQAVTLVDTNFGFAGALANLTVRAASGDISDAPGNASPIRVGGDGDFFAEAGDVALDTLDASGALRVRASGDATLINLSSAGVNFAGGASEVGGSLTATAQGGGSITDGSPVVVGGASSFTARGAGATITLDMLDAAGSVALDAFGSTIRNARALTLAASDVDGSLIATAASGGIADSGAVDVAGQATFETLAAGDITLDSTEATGGLALTTFDGDATVTDPDAMRLLTADVAGDLTVDAATVALTGDAAATGDASFTGPVTADGAGDQSIRAGAELTLAGGAEKITSGDLTLVGPSLLTLAGDASAADGSLLLNPAGRADVPDRATIVGRPDGLGTLRLEASGDVRIGPNEKTTILGSLLIDAGDQAVFGDLSALDDIDVSAPTIVLMGRDGAPLLVPDGSGGLTTSDDPDGGVDVVAGGTVTFVSDDLLVDKGAAQADPVFSTPTESVSANLANRFDVREFPETITLADLEVAGVVLDLAAPPAGGDGPPFNPAGAEGDSVLEEGPARDIERGVTLDPALVQALVRIGVPVREPTNQEQIQLVSGAALYDDYAAPDPTGRPPGAASGRLSGTVARSLVERYDALAGPDFGAVETVRARLSDAFQQFVEQADRETLADQQRTGRAFARFLEDTPVADDLRALADVDRMLADLGLTTFEQRSAEPVVLGRFMPASASMPVLRAAVDEAEQMEEEEGGDGEPVAARR